ncbi:site-2 protease family protein [Natranaerobius thermophilus]|uniref:Peptidase M50 n=1 Tax=Natranaerobius thermophilus (strain ATCC BAA-1301 / DSM 18059 / JW/NM-WN-LF) TaxID=457570 RepID=B2A4Y5_NATTJ|nr:site-2 protease family protein [Natranaerobius thermophilus]ACB85227.1 peptidase M50 [Natranaerobius thermophilus JW/NM-WN-LF]
MDNIFIGDILHIIPALLIALTVHEYSHGRIAYYLGDETAKAQGRLTLNPLDHLDPIGFLMVAIAGFGWAKPVPVNPVNFRRDVDMRHGMLLVSLAGPVSNLIMAFIFLGVSDFYLRFTQGLGGIGPGVALNPNYNHPVLYYIVLFNIFLAIFNLLPVPPLDGSRILRAIVPRRFEEYFNYLDQYGFIILILLIVSGAIRAILWPLTIIILSILYLPFQLI